MTADLDDLLRKAAARPSRALDLDALQGRRRRRRARRRMALGAVTLAALQAAAVTVADLSAHRVDLTPVDRGGEHVRCRVSWRDAHLQGPH